MTPAEYKQGLQANTPRKREVISFRGFPGSYQALKALTKHFGFTNEGETFEYILANAAQTPVQTPVNNTINAPEFGLKSPAEYEQLITDLQAENTEYKNDIQQMTDKFTNAFGGIDITDTEALMNKIMEMVAPGIQQINDEFKKHFNGIITGEEKDLTEALQKISFVFKQQKQEIQSLKTKFENASMNDGEIELNDNQALLTFNDEQLVQVRALRKYIKRLHPEIEDDPTQIIFIGIDAGLKYLEQCEKIVEAYYPLKKQPVV